MSEAKAMDIIIQLSDSIAVRAMRDSDVKSLAFHGNNKKVWDNLRNRMPHPYTEADAKWWIENCQKPEAQARSGKWTGEGGAEGPLVPLEFVITVEDEAVGGIGLSMGDDVYSRSAEIGYWLSEAFWGKGIMSKVVPAFVNWAWQTFDILVRINGETKESNKASARLLEKAGFALEGRRPNAIYKNGRLNTAVYWGMLRQT